MSKTDLIHKKWHVTHENYKKLKKFSKNLSVIRLKGLLTLFELNFQNYQQKLNMDLKHWINYDKIVEKKEIESSVGVFVSEKSNG